MKTKRHWSVQRLESRIVLDGVGLGDPPEPPALESVVVAFNDNVANPRAAAQGMIQGRGGQLGHVYEHAVKGFAAELPESALQAIANNPQVKRVEPDLIMHAFAQNTPTGVDRIQADNNSVAQIDGNDQRVDVDIAIIDSGIDGDHPDLNVYRGYNASNGPSSKWDDGYGHGTHVAGTAAALDDGQGVVGVAPGARLWAVKVLGNNGTGRLSDVIAGIDWVTAHADEIEVANMSLGGQGASPTYHQAIQQSVGAGVVYVAASGNDYRDILGSDFQFGTTDDTIPAAYPEVATISAIADTDGQPGGLGSNTEYADYFGSYADDTFADFSNFSNSDSNYQSWYDTHNKVTSPGLGIDLMMPGVDIYSTYKDGGYAVSSGTSMAAPHATGLAALYMAENGLTTNNTTRDLTGDGVWNAQDVYQLRQSLIDGGKAWDSEEGLQLPDPPTPNPDSPDNHLEHLGWAGSSNSDTRPSVEIASPTDGATVSGTITVEANAADDDAVTQVEFFVDGKSIGLGTNGTDGWTASWDTTTWSETTQHEITATATDSEGQTTTSTPPITVNVDNSVPAAMHVGDLDAGSTNEGKTWTAIVTITVHNSDETPLQDGEVSGEWIVEGVSEPASVTIDNENGTGTVEKPNIRKNIGEVVFRVSDIGSGTLEYKSGNNHDPDTDSNGTTIQVNKPLHAANTSDDDPLAGDRLAPSMIRPVVEQAISYWTADGVAPDRTDALREAEIEIADLNGSLLGLAYSDWIVLDRDAAGHGWSAHPSGDASRGLDLLAAVTHEFGHLLGFDDSHNPFDVMAPRLAPGSDPLATPAPSTDSTDLILDQFASGLLWNRAEDADFDLATNTDKVIRGFAEVQHAAPRPLVIENEARLPERADDATTSLLDDDLLKLLAQQSE